MYYPTTAPECKNGHGPMLIVTDAHGDPEAYGAISSSMDKRRFAFIAYRCPICEEVEFIDCLLPLERRKAAISTLYARRASDRAGSAESTA
jgi:hypothetical protein